MSHVFISYNKKHNREYARKLADKLLELGFDVWIDDKIDYGDDWELAIFDAIDRCAAFLPIMTPEAYQSKWVRRECQHADERNKPPFPILLSGEKFPRFTLDQYVDVRDGNLPPDNFYEHLAHKAPRKATRGIEVNAPVTPSPIPPRIQGGEQILADVKDSSSLDSPPEPKSSNTYSTTPIMEGRITKLPYPSRSQDQTLPSTPIDTAKKILPRVEDILPPPFEWCEISGGKVTLEDTNNYDGAKGGVFEVPSFKIAKYPITLKQYFAFANKSDGDADPKWWNFSEDARNYAGSRQRPDYIDCPDCPVTNVTWFDAIAFCRWLSAKTGLQITLPTEQQWQRAAIGDTEYNYPWGNNYNRNFANTSESHIGRVVSVTQYLASSPFGVKDMSGNAWEWCLTVWQTDSVAWDQKGRRCSRGGSYHDPVIAASAKWRRGESPTDRYDGLGFRLCMNL